MKSEVIHTQKEKSWMVSFVHGITSFKKSNARETALAAPEEDQIIFSALMSEGFTASSYKRCCPPPALKVPACIWYTRMFRDTQRKKTINKSNMQR